MRSMRLLPAALVIPLLLVHAPLVRGQDQTETVSRTVPLGANGTVYVKNFSGSVSITGTSRSDVLINAVRKAPKERLERINLEIESAGTDVRINANKRPSGDRNEEWGDGKRGNNNIVETALTIEVPATAALNVDVFSSGVTISGVTGAQKVKTFSADLKVTGVAAPLTAKTFSGTMQVTLASSVKAPELSLETFSGDIVLSIASDARAGVELDTFSGDLDSDIPLAITSKRKRQIRASLGETGAGASNTVRMKTFSGDVRLGKS